MKQPILLLLSLLIAVTGMAQQMQVGMAAYYADNLQGQVTAFGETYDRNAFTCAHQWHPKGTLLRVTNFDTRQSVVVRVNDRGPFKEGFVVALSLAAANAIGLTISGVARVGVEPVGYAEQNAVAPPAGQGFLPNETFNSRGGPSDNFDPQVIRSVPAGQRGFVIQIGAYSSYANAANQITALQQRGVRDAYLLEGRNQQGVVFRVVLGIFTDRSFAERFRERIQVEYYLNGVVLAL